MYPAQDTLQHVIFSMVEGGITEGGKNTASFLFHEQLNTTTCTNMKPQAKISNNFQSYLRRKTAASGGKRCR